MFNQIAKDLKSVARLYHINEEIGAPSSDSPFFFKQQQQQQQQSSSSPQAFHYNDKDMSYLLSAPTTESDAVSLIFSALGSTENLAQATVAKTVWRVTINMKTSDRQWTSLQKQALRFVPQRKNNLQSHT